MLPLTSEISTYNNVAEKCFLEKITLGIVFRAVLFEIKVVPAGNKSKWT
jgi:hypothetical protein